MRWISHIAIAASLCAVINPGAVPAAVLGSTCPDWLEWILRTVTGRRVRHRGVTHYLSTWLLLAGFAALVGKAGCCGSHWATSSTGSATP